MRTLNPNFSAAVADKQPAHILAVFHFAGGDVCISDRRVTPPGGPAFSGVVTDWGTLASPQTGLFGISVPGIEIKLANPGPSPFSTYLETGNPESVEVELFMWLEGTEYSDKETIGQFKIDVSGSVAKNDTKKTSASYNETGVTLSLVCAFKDSNGMVGTVIGRDSWPSADPKAIGKMEKIIYGSVNAVPCPAVSAGAVTTLVSDVTVSQTVGIELSLHPTEMPFPPSGEVQIGIEKISYNGLSDKVLIGVTRAVDGTTAESHKMGAKVCQVLDSYDYLVAGHPVQNIGDVYVGGVRVISGVTVNTNDGGNAMLSFSDNFVLEKAVDLNVGQGSHAHQETTWSGVGSSTSATRWTALINPAWSANELVGSAFIDSAGHYFYIIDNGSNYIDVQSVGGYTLAPGSYTGTIVCTQTMTIFQDAVMDTFDAPAAGDAYALCDKTLNDFGAIICTDGYIDTTRSFLVSDKGYIVGVKLCAAIGQSTYSGVGRSTIQGGIFSGAYVQGGGPTMQTYKTSGTLSYHSRPVSWADFSGMTIRATFYSGLASAAFFEQWIEVTYVPYNGGSSPATGVALSGKSAADYIIGGSVTCDVDGYFDDASGSFTGTPHALIENPADAIAHFLVNYLGMPASEISGSFASARQSLAGAIAGGYELAGVIDASEGGFKILENLLAQSRLMLTHDGYAATLTFLQDSPAVPVFTVEKDMVPLNGITISRTPLEEVINSLDLHYQRNFSKSGRSAAGFLSIRSSSALYPYGGDPSSQSKYGKMVPRSPMFCDFTASSAAASDLRDFFITRYKDIKRRIEINALLDCFGVQCGDIIALDWPSAAFSVQGSQFFVEEVRLSPGSVKRKKPDLIHIVAREV